MKKIIMMLVGLCCISCLAFAAEPVDFTYKSIKIGDSYDQMTKALGETSTEIDKVIAGKELTYYIYKDTRVGIVKADNSIADIRIGDKTYEARNGVKLGATPYKILKEFGKANRQHYYNQICYIYQNPNDAKEKLILDITEGYLREIRITNLDE